MTHRTIRLALAGLTLTAFVALLPPLAAAAPPAPAWQLNLTTTPTNLPPGDEAGTGQNGAFPQYTIIATNVGGAVATGPTSISATLPAGISASSLQAPRAYDQQNNTVTCSVAGQVITCTDPGSLDPGEFLAVSVFVDVSPSLADPSTVVGGAEVSGGGASAAAELTTTITAALPSFDFFPGTAGFKVAAEEADGSPVTQAGAHPYQVNASFAFPTGLVISSSPKGAGTVHDIEVEFPPGLVVNPAATPKCKEAQLEVEGCPEPSQVGVLDVPLAVTEIAPQNFAVYNMEAPPGVPAELGFDIQNIAEHIDGGVRAGEYRISGGSSDLLAKLAIFNAQIQLWGSPSDEAHDAIRGRCGPLLGPGEASCPVSRTDVPFLSMPTACTASVAADAYADSWEEPGLFHHRSALLSDLEGNPTPITGCDSPNLKFEPSLKARPTTDLADSPTGLEVDLHIPQTDDLSELATPHLKTAAVTLPPGLVINPSGANGLAGCSSAEVGIDPASGLADGDHPSCPAASRIGKVEVDTPLLEHPLPGSVYVATPHDNPFDSLLAIYIVLDDPTSGVVIKLAGHVIPDPQTGRLSAVFDRNPQLPFEDFKLDFFPGAAAALRTPATCGAYSTTSQMTPWSAPQSGPPATPADEYAISRAPGAGSCPTSAAALPNAPSFTAGSASPLAGAYAPFVLNLQRADDTQQFSTITMTPPPGLLGRLAGTPYCPEAALATAAAKSGRAEEASPSCPAASQVGSVRIGAGAGPAPYYVGGKVYLAGPYKGAPLSLAVITPATAGPYDLGTVVVRAALYVDPSTTQVTAKSDPIPQILQGIPLDVRSIALRLDKPDFTLNPTSCDPFAITSQLVSDLGQSASRQSPFQVSGCAGLPFKPNLRLAFKGEVKRSGNPAVTAVLKAPAGEANIAKTSVVLPLGEFIDNAHINSPCTRVQFDANACPAGSILGSAVAYSPLLDKPLEGAVYFRSNGGERELPDLVADLNGQIHVVLVGFIDSVRVKGSEQSRVRTRFENVPDAPVSRFVVKLKGGRKGLIENSVNLCKSKAKATLKLTAQNGRTYYTETAVANSCGKKGRDKRWWSAAVAE
jgi:hypothetical protein